MTSHYSLQAIITPHKKATFDCPVHLSLLISFQDILTNITEWSATKVVYQSQQKSIPVGHCALWFEKNALKEACSKILLKLFKLRSNTILLLQSSDCFFDDSVSFWKETAFSMCANAWLDIFCNASCTITAKLCTNSGAARLYFNPEETAWCFEACGRCSLCKSWVFNSGHCDLKLVTLGLYHLFVVDWPVHILLWNAYPLKLMPLVFWKN